MCQTLAYMLGTLPRSKHSHVPAAMLYVLSQAAQGRDKIHFQ